MIRIASRASDLARWQADHVAAALRETTGQDVVVETYTTRGDVETAPLAEIGGQGLFTAEVDRALREGRADIAVHSLKDLPIETPEGLAMAAIPERAPTGDALISRDRVPLRDLPEGARIGTSSPRRAAFLKHLRPDLEMAPLRGNVPTRIRRVREGVVDATLLAEAGLGRLGLADEITEIVDGLLPAPGQGALAVVAVAGTEAEAAARTLDHADTRTAVDAERAVLAGLGGGCSLPLGVHAARTGDVWEVRAVFFGEDGAPRTESCTDADAAEAARRCADGLRRQGAPA